MASKQTRAPSRSRREWADLIEAWKASGLTAAEFGDRNGVRPKALSSWHWRLKQAPGARQADAVPKLVQLSVADLVGAGDTDTARWELTTISGHTLRMLAQVPSTELTCLLEALVHGIGRK